jgi:hypothetical protein
MESPGRLIYKAGQKGKQLARLCKRRNRGPKWGALDTAQAERIGRVYFVGVDVEGESDYYIHSLQGRD